MTVDRSGSGGARPAKPFAEHLVGLERWLRSAGIEPHWNRVRVVERDCNQPEGEWSPEAATPAEAFAPRFAEIVRSAARGWVNLVAVRQDRDALIVAVEWFPDPDGKEIAPEQVSVNFSHELGAAAG